MQFSHGYVKRANAMTALETLAMTVGISSKDRGDHQAEDESLAA
jgi:hypothetical protein